MANDFEKINECGWSDWSIDDFTIDYERICVKLSYNTENYYNMDGTNNEKYTDAYATIYCNNFIGFAFIGHWDENIIERIYIETEGDLINSSLKEVRRLYGDSPLSGGGVKILDSIWYQLNIKLIDGNIIKVVCDGFILDT